MTSDPITAASIFRQRKRARVEETIQIGIVDYLRTVLNDRMYRVFHVANGGKRSKATAARFKAMGLLPGVPDIEIVGRGGRCFFLEIKTDDGRPSQPQRDFMAFCQVNDIGCELVRNIDQTRDAIQRWGLVTREAA